LGNGRFRGEDDLAGTLAQVTTEHPVILLAHEPDIFPKVPERVSLTLCGHTHGGQVALRDGTPIIGAVLNQFDPKLHGRPNQPYRGYYLNARR